MMECIRKRYIAKSQFLLLVVSLCNSTQSDGDRMKILPESRSLSGKALAFILPAAMLIFGISTWFAYTNAQQNEIAANLTILREDALRIQQDMEQRFEGIEYAQDRVGKLIEIELDEQYESIVDEFFIDHGDGTRRSIPQLWSGMITPHGYADGFGAYFSDLQLEPQRRRDLDAAFSALIAISQGLPRNVDNIYFFNQTNDLIIHAPNRDDELEFYRDTAPPDLDWQEEEFTTIVQPDVNPSGEMRCTSLQPIISDQSGRTWTSGCMTPVRINNRQLGGIGTSIPLDRLISSTEEMSDVGMQRIIVSADGRLIRHPDFTRQSTRDTEQFLDLSEAEEPELQALYRLITRMDDDTISTYLENGDKFVFAARLQNPRWYVISAFPGSTVRSAALSAALPVLFSGVIATLIFIFVTYYFVRRNLALPIARLTEKADEIFHYSSEGEDRARTDEDEIGRLNQAFDHMRQRIDREHSRVRRSYDAVLDTLDDFAVFIAGPGGKIIQASRGARNIFREEITPGTCLSRYLDIDDENDFQDFLTATIRNDEVHRVSERRRSDGSTFWATEVVRPLRSDDMIIGFALVLRDSTREKTDEMELTAARDAAEFEAETRKSLLATVSHEIRTPMTGILGMLEQVKEDNSARSRDRALSVIEGAVDALMRVVDDVLENARAESGKMTIEERKFESSDLIRRISELFAPLAKRKGLILEIDPGPRELLKGDPARIQQIVANFLSNAIKFTPSGGVKLSCRSRESTEENVTLAISVEDHGIGISPDRVEALFEAYEQATETTKKTFGGTGLGLFISKQLAEAMGGTIEVESEVGKGSRFTLVVTLPRQQHIDESLPGKAKTALVIGATAMARLTAEAALEELGFRTKSVGSVEDLADDETFDLAILDRLPAEVTANRTLAGRVFRVAEADEGPLAPDEIAHPITHDKLRELLLEKPL